MMRWRDVRREADFGLSMVGVGRVYEKGFAG
jgi:hypothetical protein